MPIRFVVFLTLLSLAAIAAACGGAEEPADAKDDLALIWEAWGEITENHADSDALDPMKAVTGAVNRILALSGAQPYPFLTEMGRMRGQAPREVPGELRDVWRSLALYQQANPEVSMGVLAEAAVAGMVAGLGDPSSVFLTAEQYPQAKENLKSSLEGTYLGIGARVLSQDGLIFLFPNAGSPAERGGIQDGDVLFSVAGETVTGQSVREVVEKVKGPEGSKVALQVLRQDEAGPLDLEIFRGNVDVPSVESQLLPGGIGFVRISRFRDNTAEQAFAALESLKRFDTLALILDLRNIPGGDVAAANGVAGQFLPTGAVFRIVEDQAGKKTEELIVEDPNRVELEGLEVAVLVNEGTSREAEALAGALQDNQRAVLIGTETSGDGSTYGFVELSDGSAMYLPVARWYTPSGTRLDLSGLAPDLIVTSEPEEEGFGGESQFNRAYEYLDALLPPFR